MPEVQIGFAGTRARVLVVASDRRYRAVIATLLSQRGYDVSAAGAEADVVQLATREHADVVVIDASTSLTDAACQAARLESLRPRVGVVAVSANPSNRLAALPVLPKWGEFEELFEAVQRAGDTSRPRLVAHAVR